MYKVGEQANGRNQGEYLKCPDEGEEDTGNHVCGFELAAMRLLRDKKFRDGDRVDVTIREQKQYESC